MVEIKTEKCPYCNYSEIVEAHLSTYGGATIEKGKVKSAGIHVLVCKDCGSIVRMFITDTKKL